MRFCKEKTTSLRILTGKPRKCTQASDLITARKLAPCDVSRENIFHFIKWIWLMGPTFNTATRVYVNSGVKPGLALTTCLNVICPGISLFKLAPKVLFRGDILRFIFPLNVKVIDFVFDDWARLCFLYIIY